MMRKIISLIIICNFFISIMCTVVNAKTITNAEVEGSIKWAIDKKNASVTSYSGWCLKFVADAWWSVNVSNSGYSTATLAGNAMITNTDQNPPRGATVFWYWTDPNDGVNYGHVGISLGNGQVIHADYNGIKITGLYLDSTRTYRGWGIWGNHTLETTSTSTPIGNLDSAIGGQGTVTVVGWAFDRDSLSTPLRIHVYIGGQAGDPNAEGYDVGIADSYRPDVNLPINYPGVGDFHGFNLRTTTTKRGSQPVYVYAINVGTYGENKLIGSPTVNISEISRPGTPNLWLQKDMMNSNEMVTFHWGKTDNTVCYDLKIYDWNSPANLITQVIGISAENTDWSISLPPGHYSANLVARNSVFSEGGNWITFSVIPANAIPQKSINYNGHFYYRFDDDVSWYEANEIAIKSGGHLASIASDEENNIIKELISNGTKERYWLGATDVEEEGNWKWTTGEAFQYSKWLVNNPDNYSQSEHFLEIFKDGYWNDVPNYLTTNPHGFVIEIEPNQDNVTTFNGNTYILFNESLQWTEAKEFCESVGGHLATITSLEEQTEIKNLIAKGSKERYWIGATDKDKTVNDFLWVTGEPFLYNSWNINQPDNANGNEDYLEIVKSLNYNWNDVPNDSVFFERGFVLEIENQNTLPISTEIVSAIKNGQNYMLNVKLTNNSILNDMNCKLIYTLTDENNKTISTKIENVSINKMSNSNYNFQIATEKDAKSANVFIWNITSLLPLSNKSSKVFDDATYFWSEYTQTIPSYVNAESYDIEQKTQYSYRDKEFSTSNLSTMDGWNLYSTIHTGWSEWSPWSLNPTEQNDERQVQTQQVDYGYNRTVYHVNRYRYWNSSAGMYYNSYADVGGGSWQYASSYSDYAYIDSSYGSARYRNHDGGADANFWFNRSTTQEWVSDIRTEYRYSTKTYTYYFWRWQAWSQWQDQVLISNQDKEVKTMNLYRYRLKSS